MYSTQPTSEYVPKFFDGCLEMEVLSDTLDYLLDQSLETLNQVLANQRIQTADADKISELEKLLKIYPSEGTPLEERRLQVMMMWHIPLPYSRSLLEAKLASLVGAGNLLVTIDGANFKIRVQINLVGAASYADVMRMLKQIVPVNMVVEVSILYNCYASLEVFKHSELENYTHAQLREEVLS